MKNKYLDYSNVELPAHLYANLFDDIKLMPLYSEVGLNEFRKFYKSIKASLIYENQFSSYTDDELNSVESVLTAINRTRVIDTMNNLTPNAKELLNKSLGLFLDRNSFDNFVNSWWKHKRNFYSVLSTLEGWNEKNLAVTISQKYNTTIDWHTATIIFLSLVFKPWHNEPRGLSYRNYSHNGYDSLVIDTVRELIVDAYRLLVLDDINVPKRDVLMKQVFAPVGGDKICYKSQRIVAKHLQDNPVSIQTAEGKYTNVFESKFGFSFSKFPELFYNQGINDIIHAFSGNRGRYPLPAYQFLIDNFSDRSSVVISKDLLATFKSALYSYLGAHKPETTKLNVVKKLLSFFMPIGYIDVSGYLSDSNIAFDQLFTDLVARLESPALSFKAITDWMYNNINSIRVPFKVKLRNADNTGFEFSDAGSYNQLYAKLIECFTSTIVSDDYLISIHPMSMFFSSYGTTFTSCHNVLTYTTQALAERYRRPDATGNWYKGNYEAAAGGGFVVVVPSAYLPEKQWSVPNHTRFALWMSDNLDLIRMHLSYPGKPTDGEAKAEAKAIRVMIHELLAPWHNIGTAGWKSKDINADVRGFSESIALTDGKTGSDVLYDKNHNPTDLNRYSGYTSEPIWSYSFFNGPGSPTHYTLPVGVQVQPLNHNSVNYHGYFYNSSDTNIGEKPNVNRPMFVDINGQAVLLTSKDFGFARDKKSYVLNPKTLNLSKHHTILLDSLEGFATCVKCNKHFTADYMKGDVCLDHVATSNSNIFSTLVAQPNVDVHFSYNTKDELMSFLLKLNMFDKDIKWKNSSSLTSFLPDGNFVLSLVGKHLVLKMPVSKPNVVVYNVADVAFE